MYIYIFTFKFRVFIYANWIYLDNFNKNLGIKYKVMLKTDKYNTNMYNIHIETLMKMIVNIMKI